MGKILHDLCRITLPDRENHNSRMFIDLCENIHIHYREFRIVFSLDEYFEFVDIVQRSTEDVRNYLAQNPDYQEHAYPTMLIVAGGRERQRKLLEHSPEPHRTTYFANDFAIELQDESVVDEIHVHWRDFRFAMPREHFYQIADAFTAARKELESYEASHTYVRRPHHDRSMESFRREREKYSDFETRLLGEKDVPIADIKTRFKDIERDFRPDANSISLLQRLYQQKARVSPVLLSTEKNGEHHVIDGNHRLLAARRAGLTHVNCVIAEITFEQSHNFRKAEALLKEFDAQTDYRFNTSAFNRDFIAYKMNRFYKDHFFRALNPTARTKALSKLRVVRRQIRNRIRQAWQRLSPALRRGPLAQTVECRAHETK